ncbi:glucosyl transferase [Candidatus Pantoea bituminis]|uniref:glucosyl transferase n=1 Tax=Candidatus Pantoea bituminis TaxID=2831036 RepID=UPI001C05FE90|nr:glucosyl transferase [Pantoea bituminis]
MIDSSAKSSRELYTTVAVFIISLIIMVLRRPDIINHAQPWAEDGKIWLAGIYNNGFWSSLILPQNGYYQTISRLTYGVSILFGVSNAALVSNIIAISIRCFLICFLISKRMSFIDIKFRIAAALYLILMPNISEGFVNITNIHWYLSMYLMTIVLANNPNNTSSKIHDFVILIISGLSGPFVVFIAPCLLLKRLHERGNVFEAVKKINFFDAIMATCCIIQVVAILGAPDTARSSAPLGASLGVLIKIISYRIIGGTFTKNDIVSFMPEDKHLCALLFVIFSIPFLYFLIRGGWRFRAAAIFPVMMFGFALAKPMMSITDPQWPVFFGPGNGERYFFVTNFAFFCFILFIVSKITKGQDIVFSALLAIALIGSSQDFRMNKLPDVGYQDDLKKLQSAEVGDHVTLRINPPGWTMMLIKK